MLFRSFDRSPPPPQLFSPSCTLPSFLFNKSKNWNSSVLLKQRMNSSLHYLSGAMIQISTSIISTRFMHMFSSRIHIYKSRRERTHHAHSFNQMKDNRTLINSIGFTIKYQTPYNQCEWRTQSFTTLDEANRMIAFYRSCGSPAELV